MSRTRCAVCGLPRGPAHVLHRLPLVLRELGYSRASGQWAAAACANRAMRKHESRARRMGDRAAGIRILQARGK